jgi:hypothetical protein
MLPIRWIMPIVGLLFAVALLPRFLGAPERTPQRVADVGSGRASVTVNDRFGRVDVGSAGQREAAPPPVQTDPADRAGPINVLVRNDAMADANANDLTGSVQPSADPPPAKSDSALAVGYPVVAAPAVAKPQPAKRVRHVRRSRSAPIPARPGLAAQGGSWPSATSYTGAVTPSATGSAPPSPRAKRQKGQLPATGQNNSAAQASYAAQQQPLQTTPPVSGFPNAQY